MMRWSIIRLIWMRDLRDQLRDRRTLFMIAGLPLLLYPVLGAAVLGFALGFSEQPNVIGVVRPAGLPDDFPPREPPTAGAARCRSRRGCPQRRCRGPCWARASWRRRAAGSSIIRR